MSVIKVIKKYKQKKKLAEAAEAAAEQDADKVSQAEESLPEPTIEEEGAI